LAKAAKEPLSALAWLSALRDHRWMSVVEKKSPFAAGARELSESCVSQNSGSRETEQLCVLA